MTASVPEGPVPEDEELGGLAAERTELSWNRNGLAMVVVAAAILRQLIDPDRQGAAAITAALLVAGAAAWIVTLGYSRTVASPALAGRVHADPARLRAVAVGTVLLGAGALVLVMLADA